MRAKRAVEERIARPRARQGRRDHRGHAVHRREGAALAPPGTPVHVVPNGCDFDDFDGLAVHAGRAHRRAHAGSFFGQRSPRPFLEAVAALDDPTRSCARFLGDLRPADRDWALDLGLGDRLEIDGFRPHRETLAAMKAADVLLLLVPRAGGRGLSVLSGKVYEYLASERPVLALVPPEGAAADAAARDGRRLDRRSRRSRRDPRRAPRPPAMRGRTARSRSGRSIPIWRERLDRRTRAREMAEVLRG